ncbi:hypothetical protein ACIOGZ_28840 [Kitasatospora sp. NPDC088160]|uniref:hypothetical protein n=1 Tax=Kitasatospora sp. NPDC088160 TaxID=3364072 RepID=UPI00382E13B7
MKGPKRLARDPAARSGALHRMRVLDTHPRPQWSGRSVATPAPAASSPTGTRGAPTGSLARVGIRDAAGRKVGPVYGIPRERLGEYEGVTFRRERVWVRSSTVRSDLSAPHDRRIYELENPARPDVP